MSWNEGYTYFTLHFVGEEKRHDDVVKSGLMKMDRKQICVNMLLKIEKGNTSNKLNNNFLSHQYPPNFLI